MSDSGKVTLPGGFSPSIRSVAFVAIFAVVGTFLLIVTHASPFASSAEPEDGTVSGTALVEDSSASGGKAVRFGGTDIASASNPLPFDMPTTSTLRAAPHKVFAHYFPAHPISIDNKDGNITDPTNPAADYYTRNYLNPNPVSANEAKHAAYGGLFRERPLPRAPYTGMTNAQWHVEDMKTEVREATAAGIDGFVMDLLQIPGESDANVRDNPLYLQQAAAAIDPGFKLIIAPDMAGLYTRDPVALADYVATLSASPTTYRLSDGRALILLVRADKWTTTQWATFSNELDAKGVNYAYMSLFLNYSTYVNTYNSMSYGFANWGAANPLFNNNLAANINDSHARGKVWMQPVRAQDERPYLTTYDEANNTENLRTTWAGAIDNNAEYVQMTTWNDYSEGAEMAPSTHHGWSLLDISAYYLIKYKTGTYPTIKRDVVYLSHRIQPHDATPTLASATYNKMMVLRAGSTPARDTVEVMSFLTGPATVKVTVGMNTYTYDAPAGVFTKTYPLGIGKISVKVTRGTTTTAAVTSPFSVVSNPPVQDEQYYFVSSSRDGSPTDAQ